MRFAAAIVAGMALVGLAPACATIVGIEAIPDVDGGSDVSVPSDASVDAPGDSALPEASGEGETSDADADARTGDAMVDSSEAGVSDVAAEEPAPSCTAPGWGCVPAVPQGFDYELVDRTDTAGCAAGLAVNEVVASATGSPATCSCTCGVGQEPSCTYGTLTVGGGSMTCADGMAIYDASGACISANGVSPMFLQGGPLAASGGSCVASVGKSLSQVQETKWRTCGYAGPFGGGCPAGQVCAPVSAGLSSCVAVASNVSCPTAYPNASTVGTGVSDTRDCSTCTCAAPSAAACSSATLTFYADMACGSAVETVPIDLVCQQLAGSTYGSYAYAATPSESCGPVAQQTSPTGAVSTTGTTTLCCAP